MSSTSDLRSHIGFWMRLVSNHVSHSFARKLDATGVTVAEWVILREMFSNKNQISPSAIAELTGLSRGAVSKLVDRLENKKLVTRLDSASDGRYQILNLTKSGRQIVPELAQIADENDEAFFGVLSKAERTHLTSLLKKIAEDHQLTSLPTE